MYTYTRVDSLRTIITSYPQFPLSPGEGAQNLKGYGPCRCWHIVLRSLLPYTLVPLSTLHHCICLASHQNQSESYCHSNQNRSIHQVVYFRAFVPSSESSESQNQIVIPVRITSSIKLSIFVPLCRLQNLQNRKIKSNFFSSSNPVEAVVNHPSQSLLASPTSTLSKDNLLALQLCTTPQPFDPTRLHSSLLCTCLGEPITVAAVQHHH
ncbi:hypothetical protein EDB86DRAFT_291200 [Lactarius hatsudake]|nr:hypothetical protein EDB86DRAFT_291200 [Lactarius hatsudake]